MKQKLSEGCWAFPNTEKDVKALIELLKKVEKNQTKSTSNNKFDTKKFQDELYSIFGEDHLFDSLNDLNDGDVNNKVTAIAYVLDRLRAFLKHSEIPKLELKAKELLTDFSKNPNKYLKESIIDKAQQLIESLLKEEAKQTNILHNFEYDLDNLLLKMRKDIYKDTESMEQSHELMKDAKNIYESRLKHFNWK